MEITKVLKKVVTGKVGEQFKRIGIGYTGRVQ